MITYYHKKSFLKEPLDFRLVNAFEEVADYKRHFKLPFNVLAFRLENVEKREMTKEKQDYILNCNTGEYFYRASNQCCFIPYGLPVLIETRPYMVSYSLHFTLERYPGADIFRGCNQILTLDHLVTESQILQIFYEENPLKARCLAEALICRICAEILPEQSDKDEEWRFADLLREVRRKIDARWNVEMLASKAHLSTGAFSREFSSHMEYTAKDFLQNELLHKAVILLQEPHATVQSVAEQLCFSSPFYFSKFFKRRYGIAPQEYIRRHNSVQTQK